MSGCVCVTVNECVCEWECVCECDSECVYLTDELIVRSVMVRCSVGIWEIHYCVIKGVVCILLWY